jgi:ribosome-binding protein aMBF1 (putative translation factor)
MARTRDFGAVIERTLAKEPELRAAVEHERLNARIATLILAAREAAGLTQQQLAELIGSRQSVIARLEDADYQGHSLTMLAKIAHALDRQVLVKLEPIVAKRAGATLKSKSTSRSTKRNR